MYEVVVVGAGPAGSIAAAVLAKHGCQVLLLDKAEFPRDKACGDCIGWNSLRLLSDLGLSFKSRELDFHRCDRVRAISPSGYVFEGAFPQEDGYYRHSYVVPRKNFDHILWEFALQQGAEFERLRVTEPIVERGAVRGVRGRIAGKTVERRARVTIAADGAKSAIVGFLRKDKAVARHYGVAMRTYLRGVTGLDHCVEFHFNQTVLPGYGWVFPLGEGMANVGVGLRLDVFYKNGQSLVQVFERFIHDPRVAERLSKATQVGETKGWVLSLASQQVQRAYDGVLLVGDAGAFTSPLTGGGIYNALESGWVAAQVALEALENNDCSLKELHKFEARWRTVLGEQLRTEAIMQRLLSLPGMLDLLIGGMCRSQRLASFVLSRI